MSKELIGKNGKIVGSAAYFQEMNRNCKIAEVVKVPKEYQYFDGCKELARSCKEIVSVIYQDVKKCADILAFLPEKDRQETAELAKAIGEISRQWGSASGDVNQIVSLVLLSASASKRKSSESMGMIEKTERKLRSTTGSSFSMSEKINLLQKAVSGTVFQAASNDAKKLEFLMSIEQGKGKGFLQDVLHYYDYLNHQRNYVGKNGKVVCSREYNQDVQKKAFFRGFPRVYSYGHPKKYVSEIQNMLKKVCDELSNDLDQGDRNKDYILDENGKICFTAIEQCGKVGISCAGLKNKVEKLMWFVGGNQQKILTLQRNINALGIRGTHGWLKEDGVFGEETLSAWNELSKALVSGSVPVLTYIDVLQSDLTKVTHEVKMINTSNKKAFHPSKFRNLPTNMEYSYLLYPINGKKERVFMFDLPHKNADYYHINYPLNKPAFLKSHLDHKPIPEFVYLKLKNFKEVGKVVHKSGRVLLVAGVLLDTLELGNTILSDLQDADKKIGKKTGIKTVEIGGRWAGAAIGAKAGAMAGASIGTAMAPGIGTAIGGASIGIVGGIIGAAGGEKFVDWIFDITGLIE